LTEPARPFRRRANPLPMVFRLSFLYSFLVMPCWYILRGFPRESIPDLLGVYFSVLILLTLGLIRLRVMLNSPADRRAVKAAGRHTSAESDDPLVIEQSFGLRDYAGLNAEVMFSYLRPYLSLLSGFAFLALFVVSLVQKLDTVRTALAFALTLYYLTVPWLLFLVKTRKIYLKSKPYLDKQIIEFKQDLIGVRAGSSPRADVDSLTDIAVTRSYLLLFASGSSYIQVRRDRLEESAEDRILNIAVRMLAEPAGGS
jgi:hypothetical protein